MSRSRSSRSSGSSSRSSKKWDVEELEMLLEAYFVQIEGTMNKLSSVSLHSESDFLMNDFVPASWQPSASDACRVYYM